MGLKIYPVKGAVCSPDSDRGLRAGAYDLGAPGFELRVQGWSWGGNYGKLAGKVFRIGHMGSQANINLIKEAMDILETVVHDI